MQDKSNKKAAFRCLVIIVDGNIRNQVTEFLADAKIPLSYQMHGVGTVRSDILNLLGLGDTHKSITLCFAPREQSRLLLAEMNHALLLHKKGTGIAVSVPIDGLQGWLYKLLGISNTDPIHYESEKEVKKMSETITHAMILVSLNPGYSEDVMCTARTAGATGGTIVKGLQCSPAETASRFGIPLQAEQEILIIVVPKEKKTEIMSAISSAHGVSSPAHGIAISLPVDAIAGI